MCRSVPTAVVIADSSPSDKVLQFPDYFTNTAILSFFFQGLMTLVRGADTIADIEKENPIPVMATTFEVGQFIKTVLKDPKNHALVGLEFR